MRKKHDWKRQGSLQWSKMGLSYKAARTDYKCKKCNAVFSHYYNIQPNINIVKERAEIKECNNKEAEMSNKEAEMSNKQTTCKEFYDFVKEYINDYKGGYIPSKTEKSIALDIVLGLLDEEKFMNPIKEKAIKPIVEVWERYGEDVEVMAGKIFTHDADVYQVVCAIKKSIEIARGKQNDI